jgi:ferric enterobactin receptor
MMSRSLAAALSLAILLSAPSLQAQNPQNPPRPIAAAQGEIRGRVVDSVSGRAVPTASITVRRASDSSFASGALVREDGTFKVEGLSPGTYVVRVRSLGFAQLSRPNVAITADRPIADLGTIGLKTVAAKLETQNVTAEREETVVQPDRTVYSTKNMPAATGGTAIDVLRNIPQVEVDASNRVSLRGNGNVVIQINGRPTPIKGDQLGTFLAQLPANTVKTVEVAANPSAKDDPEGTAGIINIVLNQETEVGLSGGLSASTSSTGQASGFGNVGKQQGKFIGFVSANVYTDRRRITGTISRENLQVTTPQFVETDMRGSNRPLSVGGNLRSEYRFTKANTLTLDGYLGGGHFENRSRNSYVDLNSSRSQIGAFHQLNEGQFDNFYQDWDLAFRRQGKPTEPQLTVEAEYSNSRNDNNVDLSGAVTQPDAATPATIRTERDHTLGKYPFLNAKLDYAHPFGGTTKLELGAKYQDRATVTDFTAAYQDSSTGVYSVDAARSTNFDYREHIGGAYALLSRSFISKIQTQIGARLEDATTRFDLPLTNLHFDKHYASVYPSGIFTYNFTPLRLARVSYSRRVSRPNPWQLSPIEFRQDTRNVFRGNPDLGAEYTDALDFSIQDARKWGSIQLNPFARRTNNAVRNIQYIDANGVSVGTFANLAHNSTVGADLNVNYRRGPFTGGGGGGISRYSSDARNLTITSTNLSTQAISWSARANGTWKFNNKWDAQLFSNYRAPTKTEGGSSLAFVNMSFGGRYKVWGDQGNVSVRVNDPFGMSKFGYRTSNGQIVEYSRRYFQARAVFVSITRNFGQALQLKAKSQSEDQAAPPPP